MTTLRLCCTAALRQLAFTFVRVRPHITKQSGSWTSASSAAAILHIKGLHFDILQASTVDKTMGDQTNEQILAPLQKSVKEQGDLVRKLKSEGAAENDVKAAVMELKARKKVLEEKVICIISL